MTSRSLELLKPDDAAPPSAEDAILLQPMSAIEEKAVAWLWPQTVPFGKLTLFVGDPGYGKSYLTVDLAARVSSGSPLPDGTPVTAAPVLMVFCEDDASDTVVPRLRCAGANLDRVYAMTVRGESNDERLLNLGRDLAGLEARIASSGAKLFTIDPVGAFFDGKQTNSWKDDDVRRLLAGVALMAGRTGCAVVGVMHLNKKITSNVLQRITGAGAFGAVARSVFLIGPHPEDSELPPADQRRVFASAKQNLSAAPVARLFRVIESTDTHGRFVWDGTTNTTAQDMVLADMGVTHHADKSQKARDLLNAQLSSGPKAAASLFNLARTQDVSPDTLKTAKRKMGIISEQVGGDGKQYWVWRLPDDGEDTPF